MNPINVNIDTKRIAAAIMFAAIIGSVTADEITGHWDNGDVVAVICALVLALVALG